MITNTFRAECFGCKAVRDRCATVYVIGTNAWGDREGRVIVLCGPCRKSCKGRCRLHPKHKAPGNGKAG